MNGKIFKKALDADERSITALAKLFGVERQTLYDVFKMSEVPEFYKKKAQELGITIDDTAHSGELEVLRGVVSSQADQIKYLHGEVEFWRKKYFDCDTLVSRKGK